MRCRDGLLHIETAALMCFYSTKKSGGYGRLTEEMPDFSFSA